MILTSVDLYIIYGGTGMDKNAEVDTCFRHRYCFAGRRYRWCSCKDEVIISGSKKLHGPLLIVRYLVPGQNTH